MALLPTMTPEISSVLGWGPSSQSPAGRGSEEAYGDCSGFSVCVLHSTCSLRYFLTAANRDLWSSRSLTVLSLCPSAPLSVGGLQNWQQMSLQKSQYLCLTAEGRHEEGQHSPPASPAAPHRVAVRDITLQGCPARSPVMCLVIIRLCNHCEGGKKGPENKEARRL